MKKIVLFLLLSSGLQQQINGQTDQSSCCEEFDEFDILKTPEICEKPTRSFLPHSIKVAGLRFGSRIFLLYVAWYAWLKNILQYYKQSWSKQISKLKINP